MKSKSFLLPLLALAVGTGIGWVAKTSHSSSTANKSAQTNGSQSASGSRFFSNSEQSSAQESGTRTFSGSPSEAGNSSNSGDSGQTVAALGKRLRLSSDPMERIRLMDQLLSQLTAENALSMRELIQDLDSDAPEFEMFHYAWGQIAGKEAVTFGLDSRERDGGPIFRGWAQANPDAAQTWLATIDFENDPAFAKINERGISQERLTRYLHDEFLHGLYLNDPQKAAQYLATLPEDQASFVSRDSEELVEEIISRNGINAAREWVELLPSNSLSSRAVGEIADEWSEREPRAALDWAMTHENEVVRRSALENVWRNMARGEGGADVQAAAEEINAMPASTDKDSALAGYSDGTRSSNPRGSVDAAMNISDPELREESLLRNGGYYLRREPKEATQWLQNSGFSQELVDNITRNAKRGRR